jgi:predicted metal-dependent phosphoesterase TrpH
MPYRVEFHCHTSASKDCLTTPEKMIEACLRKGIDRLVVTDHNTIAGALKAKEIDPERVIVGEEIMTQAGELLAVYVKEEIPPGLSPGETIARLREQGAYISVSHPFDQMRKGAWQLPDLLAIRDQVDAIEIFNARCIWPSYNHQARDFALEYGLVGTTGSDAHTTFELGAATMLLSEFDDADSLREAVPQATNKVRLLPPWVHFSSTYAKWIKKQGR